MNEGDRLRKGYSGAPVVDLEIGYVLGVATNMEKDGTEGLAISVEALEKIWREIPTDVSQQIRRESLENSDSLSVEETQPEILENSDSLSVEETQPEILDIPDSLSVEETQPEILDIPDHSLAQQITQPFDVITVNNKGEEIERRSHEAAFFTEDLGNGVVLEMVAIPGGSFIMGSPENEEGRRENETPQHEVTLQPFYMSKYPITQNQYQAIMGKNPSRFQGGNRPVEFVSWYDAVEFCQKISQKTGKTYRLPSESQWEYACRAGTTTPFYFGETITSELVNYNGNYTYGNAPKGKYREETTDVGIFPPNAFGLYDMHGNVWEWCADDWHKNYEGAPTDGSACLENDEKEHNAVLRGGCWIYIPNYCRSAFRSLSIRRDNHINNIGFRLVWDSGRTL
ncbi:MAG: formylglycine-generating enzyme family protein [Okeania sp. SIO3I5]|nr:formylglycine-generating enzyme family protein [Okeania sp. SIO3I5]